jgi:mono/diheme cytochrome c family protein
MRHKIILPLIAMAGTVGVVLALGPANRSQAQLVVYDGFQYTSNSSLTNAPALSGGGSFGLDGWRAGQNTPPATNAGSGIIFSNPTGNLPAPGSDAGSAGGSSSVAGVAGQIQRGQYLVERVGVCGECHSPKNDKGEYDRSQWLQGELIDYKPTRPMPFAAIAPPIAGLPTFASDAAAVKFFETGTNAQGKAALPPMPQFRLNREDTVAVVAYLRSLKR